MSQANFYKSPSVKKTGNAEEGSVSWVLHCFLHWAGKQNEVVTVGRNLFKLNAKTNN